MSIFNPDTQTVHTLSASATAIWHQLEVCRDLDGLVQRVAGVYDVAVEQVRTDVAAAVRTLVEAGVVVHERHCDQ